jgi:hypothetical protein
VTIGAYLVIGPYFLLGWITKAIEVAIIGLVVADLVNTYGSAGRLQRSHETGAGPRRRSPEPAGSTL